MNKGSDEGFLKAIKKNLGKNRFLKPFGTIRQTHFTIKHYAGDVEYEIEEFKDKNKDSIHKDYYEVLSQSKRKIIG